MAAVRTSDSPASSTSGRLVSRNDFGQRCLSHLAVQLGANWSKSFDAVLRERSWRKYRSNDGLTPGLWVSQLQSAAVCTRDQNQLRHERSHWVLHYERMHASIFYAALSLEGRIAHCIPCIRPSSRLSVRSTLGEKKIKDFLESSKLVR